MPEPTAGLIEFKVDGEILSAKGSFQYNLGAPKLSAILGSDRPHGYKEEAQVPYIEGEITLRGALTLRKLTSIRDATVSLKHADGRLFMLYNAWYAGEGTGNTEESNVGVRFEGLDAAEVA